MLAGRRGQTRPPVWSPVLGVVLLATGIAVAVSGAQQAVVARSSSPARAILSVLGHGAAHPVRGGPARPHRRRAAPAGAVRGARRRTASQPHGARRGRRRSHGGRRRRARHRRRERRGAEPGDVQHQRRRWVPASSARATSDRRGDWEAAAQRCAQLPRRTDPGVPRTRATSFPTRRRRRRYRDLQACIRGEPVSTGGPDPPTGLGRASSGQRPSSQGIAPAAADGPGLGGAGCGAWCCSPFAACDSRQAS